MMFASYADKTAAALAKAESDVGMIAQERELHQANRPDGSELDALIDWKRKLSDFDLRVEAADEALAFARTAAAKQADLAAKAERDRAHSAAARLATIHGKLIVEIAADAEKLAEKLARAEQMRAEIDIANGAREARPFIADGEMKESPASP